MYEFSRLAMHNNTLQHNTGAELLLAAILIAFIIGSTAGLISPSA
jgi:hypothetical protein